jgi:hypothetical protein
LITPVHAIMLRSGVRAVRAERTWAALADRLTVDHLVVLGDAILHRGLADLHDLARLASGDRRRRGLRLLREALPLLEDAGWIVLQFTADDVRHRPEQTVERIRRALAFRPAVSSNAIAR